MSTYRTAQEIRRYDIFKGSVTALLVAAFLLSLLAGADAPADEDAVSLANPAAVYCQEQGFTYEIQTDDDGSQSGICVFDDGTQCDAWAYFRSECAPSGAGEQTGGALNAPDLQSPLAGSTINLGETTFSGTGSPGSTVAIISGGQQLATAAVDENGQWSAAVLVEGQPGPIELAFQTLDDAGAVAAAYGPLTFEVVDPSLRALAVAPFFADPLPKRSADGTLIVSGLAFPGAEVAVDVNGQPAASTAADSAGRWQVEIAPGAEAAVIGARLLSPDGDVMQALAIGFSIPNSSSPLSIDTPDEEPVAGPITLSGGGQPGQTALLQANGETLGEVTVGDDGLWMLEAEFAAGDYALTIAAVDDQESPSAAAELQLVVGPAPAPVVSLPAPALPAFNPLTGATSWAGASEPGTRVAAIIDGAQAAVTEADGEGAWQLDLPLPAGPVELQFARLGPEDAIIASSEPNTVALPGRLPALTLPAYSLSDESLDLAAGNGIENGVPGEGPLPTISLPSGPYTQGGTAEPGTQVALLVNGEQVDVDTADNEGDFTLSTELEAGRQPLQLAVLDQDNAMIAQSRPLMATVVEAQVPEIDVPADPVAGGTVTLSGTAEPGANIIVTVGGETVGETTAGPDGRWAIELAERPGAGAPLRARQRDDQGNLLLSSAPYYLPDSAAGSSAETEGGEGALPGVDGTIGGEVTYRERIALPDDAVVTVQLQAISRAGESALVLGQQIIALEGDQVPVPFTISYDPAVIDANSAYTIAARVADGSGNLLFINDGAVPVLTNDSPTDDVTVQTVKVATSVSDAVLDESAVDLPDDEQSVVAAAEGANGQFSILLQGLEEAGIAADLAAAEGAFTLFAPADEAFAQLPGAVTAAWQEDPQAYLDLLRNLVVEGSYAPDSLSDGQVLPTLAGEEGIAISRDGDLLFANGVPVVDFAAAGSSVVYGLSEVILPPLPDGVQPPVIDEEGVPTFVGPLLTVVGLAEPGTRILLTVDGAPFGEIADVDETGFWLVRQNVDSGIRYILAYMLDENGRLLAISQEVVLPVP